jgi:hypothetical protein
MRGVSSAVMCGQYGNYGTVNILDKIVIKTFKNNSDYINEKEKQLEYIMHTEPIEWYIENLTNIFSKVEIVNSRLGFTTFLCINK